MEMQVEKSPLPATTKVYDVALKGDTPSFLNLLKEDPLILDRCIIENSGCIMQSPLHVAVNMGHFQFTVEILHRKPELAEVLDQRSKSSPLHVASAKGYLEIVKRLIMVSPGMCLARDQDGLTPIHVAAVKGHISVVEELHHTNRYAAQERTNNGESVLHLCIKHSQLEALKTLLRLTDDDGDQLINSKDNNGNTILHLAVTNKQAEMVDILLRQQTIEKNVVNNNEMTAVDIHRKQSKNNKGDKRIEQSLDGANVKPAKEAHNHETDDSAWLENQRSSLMVVASLIATIAFQAGINPPGGFWEETKEQPIDEYPTKFLTTAGAAIWASYRTDRYNYILISNTIGLVSSLSVTLYLISGLPCKRHFLSILRIALWTAATTTAITYLNSVDLMTPDVGSDREDVWTSVEYSIRVWLVFMGAIFLGNVVRFVFKVIGWKRRDSLKKFCKDMYHKLLRNIGGQYT